MNRTTKPYLLFVFIGLVVSLVALPFSPASAGNQRNSPLYDPVQPTSRPDEPPPSLAPAAAQETIDPSLQRKLNKIALREGISADRLSLAYHEEMALPLTGVSFTYMKLADTATGKDLTAGITQEGLVVDPEALKQAEQAAASALYGKLHPSLYHYLNGPEAGDTVKVSIWLDMGDQDASIERIPPGEAAGMSLEDIRQRKAEGLARAAQIHQQVQAPLLQFLPTVGGRDLSGADTAPIVFAEIPVEAVQVIANLPDVQVIDLVVEGGPEQDGGEKPPAGGLEMATARPASKANIVEARGFTGSGVVAAVVEGDSIAFANPYIVDGTCGPTASCPSIAEHATAVGGILASNSTSARGTAPGIGASLLSANGSGWDLSHHQAATTWALGQNAEVLNNSYYLETDGVMHNSDRWMDYIVRSYADLEVKSAGNRGEGDAHVTSPGLGYNTLTVGAANDNNTLTWDDDTMAAFSSYVEPANREKPEVTAIGCADYPGPNGIITTGMASPWIYDQGCGTSYAAPIVAGGGALLMQRAPALYNWPEAEKAILIATALHNIEGGVSARSEIDGAGAVDLAAADTVAANGWWGGFTVSASLFDASGNYAWRTVHLDAGERVRVALAYDSKPTSDYTSDPLEGDLDLYLLDATSAIVASSAGVDSWEIIDYTVPTSGNYTVRIRNFYGSFVDPETTFAGIAIWPGHYFLTPYVPQVRDAPPGAWNQDSGDDYRLTRGSYWNAVGIRSPSTGDYDISLFNNSVYGDPADHALLEDSTLAGVPVDFVVIDGNHAPVGDYYTTVTKYSGSGNYNIEHATRYTDLVVGTFAFSMTTSQVVRIWDSSHATGVRKYYALKPYSGDANLGMALYASETGTSATWYQGKSQAVAAADLAGAGGSEFISYQSSTSDYLGLVVFNNSATTSTSYYLFMDTSAPTGTISVNSGATYTNTTSVTLNLSAADAETGVYQMRFSNDNSTWSGWEPYAATKAWTLAAGDGTKTAFVQFKNNAEMVSGSYGDTIILDTVAPYDTIIVINATALFTNNTSVTLSLSASDDRSGVSQMRFSNDNTTWSAWEAYATSKTWTLSAGDGSKFVYVQYRDHAGNISSAVYDTIYLDTTPPTGAISINAGAAFTNTTSVTLGYSASDDLSGVTWMRFSNDGSTWSPWDGYGYYIDWTLLPGDGTKTVYAQYADLVGNISATYSDTIILDTTPPSGTISINGGAAYTNTTSVTLTLSATDAGSGVGQMRFSNDNASWSGWEAFAASKTWTLSGGDGTKTVYVQFRDNLSNTSGSISDTIVLDTVLPAGTVLINGGAAYTNSTAVSLALSASDDRSGVAQMRFSNDGSSWSTWEAYATSKSWTMAAGDGTKTVYAQYRDAAGNVSSSAADTIILDATAPTGSISINAGAPFTASTAVTLTLSASDAASGVYQMRFSNDNATWNAWEAYATSKSWTLSGGDGVKTVYVQFRDNLLNTSGSFTDTITFDTTGPSGTILINAGAPYTISTAVTLTLSASDAGSGVAQMRFSNDGSAWSAWEAYATSKPWTLTPGDGAKTVFVQYRDMLNNASPSFTDSIGLDTLGPTGSISINASAAYTNNTSVTVNMAVTDAGSSVAQMRFSNDGVTYTGWEPYAASKTWVIPAGDGSKTVYAEFRDLNGNSSLPMTDTITLDTVPPSASASSPASVLGHSFTVSWSGSDASSGIASYDVQYREGAGGVWTDWLAGATATSAVFGPSLPLPVMSDQVYYFRVRAHDLAGNVGDYPGGDGHTQTYVQENIPSFLPVVMK